LKKVPAMLKPFLPQLQRTFVKSLSEVGSTTTMRQKTAQCLSLLIPLQTRLDPLVMELVQGIKQSDAEVKKSMWEALFGLLQGVGIPSGKSLNETSQTAIQALLLDAAMSSGEYEVAERIGASKCFGSFCHCLSVQSAQTLIMELSDDIKSKQWIYTQGLLMCFENVIRYSFSTIDESVSSRMVQVTIFALRSAKTALVESAIHVAYELIENKLHTFDLIEMLIQNSQPTNESTDARRDAIMCIKGLAKHNHKVFIFNYRILFLL
jgi:hypothetical protein